MGRSRVSTWGLSARNREGGRLRSFCFVVVAETGSACAFLKLDCKFKTIAASLTGHLSPLHRGPWCLGCVHLEAPPPNMTSFKDFIHFPGIPVTSLRIYMSSMTIIIFSFLISLCYCPVLAHHINANCKNAIVQCWSVYSSLMLEQVHRPSPDHSPVLQ